MEDEQKDFAEQFIEALRQLDRALKAANIKATPRLTFSLEHYFALDSALRASPSLSLAASNEYCCGDRLSEDGHFYFEVNGFRIQRRARKFATENGTTWA